MRALRYVESGQLDWQEIPTPEAPDAGGALVRPLAVARCDLDAPMVQLGLFPGPYTVGHEFVASVLEVGSDVTTHRVGDLVLVPFQPSCGACGPCRAAHYAACATYRAQAGAAFGFGPAGGDHDGAMSEVVRVRHADHLLLGAPDLSLPALATLPDNVVDAYRAVAPVLQAGPDAEVLVLGGFASSVGLYAVALARALGVRVVRYVDDDADRCEAAAALGATAELCGRWPRRFDRAAITVENTGSQEGLVCALRSTEDYGTCTTTAIHFAADRQLPMLELYTRGIRLEIGRADSRRVLPAVIDLVREGGFDPLIVPNQIVEWDKAAEAWLAPTTKLIVVRA